MATRQSNCRMVLDHISYSTILIVILRPRAHTHSFRDRNLNIVDVPIVPKGFKITLANLKAIRFALFLCPDNDQFDRFASH